MTAKAKPQYKDFESALDRLEEITEQLESGESSLEEAIELYTEGLKIAKFCNDKLSDAEKKIKLIVKDSEVAEEVDFEEEIEG